MFKDTYINECLIDFDVCHFAVAPRVSCQFLWLEMQTLQLHAQVGRSPLSCKHSFLVQ